MRQTLDQLKEMTAKSTKGPWHADDYGGYIWGPNMEMIADKDDEEAYLLRMRGTGEHLPQVDNRDLIVALVNAAPRLITFCEAAEKLVEFVRPLTDHGKNCKAGNLHCKHSK